MGFFNQLSKKASDTVQSAKDKTSKFSTEVKLKSKLSDKKDKITMLYLEMGKEVYLNYTKGINENTENVLEILKEIADINKDIENINKNISDLKGIKNCSSCGYRIPNDAEFCPKCRK